MTIRTLSDRERLFVDEYLVDQNATQAALRSGYSARTARQIGAENLSKPDIRELLEISFAAAAKRNSITIDDYIETLRSYTQADLADLFDDQNNLKPPSEWNPIWRKGLVEYYARDEIKLVQGQPRLIKTRLRLANREKWLRDLGRAIGAFV